MADNGDDQDPVKPSEQRGGAHAGRGRGSREGLLGGDGRRGPGSRRARRIRRAARAARGRSGARQRRARADDRLGRTDHGAGHRRERRRQGRRHHRRRPEPPEGVEPDLKDVGGREAAGPTSTRPANASRYCALPIRWCHGRHQRVRLTWSLPPSRAVTSTSRCVSWPRRWCVQTMTASLPSK